MKRFLTKHGIMVLSAATAIAVVLSLVSFFSSNTDLLTNIVNTVSTPFRSASAAVADWVGGKLRYASEYDAMKERIEELELEMAKMEEQLRQAEADSEENQRLRKLLDLREQQRDLQLESARVIQRDASNWEATLSLSVGTDFGVEIGDCVITEAGYLVGIITDAGSNWSTCTALIDTEFSMGAVIFRTGDVGVAQGDFNLMQEGQLRLGYLDAAAAPQVGDLVVTSGLGGYYPSQMVIGYIREVMTADDGLAQYAVLEPAADLDQIKQVFVVKDFTVVE